MASLSVYSATVTDSGDVTLIAAPGAGQRIVPMSLLLQNATTTADVYLLYSGASSTGTKLLTVRAQNQGDGYTGPCAFEGDTKTLYELKCGENKALVLNKAQAVGCNVTVWYRVEPTFGG